jgi:hypothetical protein
MASAATQADIDKLFADIESRIAAMSTMGAFNFLRIQETAWEQREAALARWATHGGAKPFNGELDAFDIANIRNRLAARKAALSAGQSLQAAE